MDTSSEEQLRAEQICLANKAGELADEVKLLAINLAISLARIQGRDKTLKELEPHFTELIKKSNEASHQVTGVLEAFQNQKKIIYNLPASSEVVAKRGAYDRLEATLNHIYDLSQKIIQTITVLKGREKVG